MINLRYHVVSLTAVFLAIGIGIAFGASMVNRATVAVLEREVSDQNERIAEIEAEGVENAEALVADRERAARFEAEGRSRLLTGHIVNDSVLAIAPIGTTEETVAAFERVALESESKYAGLIRFTDRLGLGRPTDQAKMTAILERDLDPDGLRRLLAERIGELLLAAGADAPEPDPDLTIPTTSTTIPPPPTTTTVPESDPEGEEPGTTTSTSAGSPTSRGTTTTSTTISEAAQRLRAAQLAQESYNARVNSAAIAARTFFDDLERDGFLTYTRSRARSLEEALTPNTEVRIVVLSDDGALEAPAAWVEQLIRVLIADGVAPVVIAQPELSIEITEESETSDGDETDGDGESDENVGALAELPAHDLVSRLRRDEPASQRLSTISHLTSFDGEVATVFALEDLPGRVGHYGPEAGTDGVVPDNSP